MSTEDIQRRYIRKPKPESKIGLSPNRLWWAYDRDGNCKGQVRLTHETKKQYEERGFTFKAVHR